MMQSKYAVPEAAPSHERKVSQGSAMMRSKHAPPEDESPVSPLDPNANGGLFKSKHAVPEPEPEAEPEPPVMEAVADWADDFPSSEEKQTKTKQPTRAIPEAQRYVPPALRKEKQDEAPVVSSTPEVPAPETSVKADAVPESGDKRKDEPEPEPEPEPAKAPAPAPAPQEEQKPQKAPQKAEDEPQPQPQPQMSVPEPPRLEPVAPQPQVPITLPEAKRMRLPSGKMCVLRLPTRAMMDVSMSNRKPLTAAAVKSILEDFKSLGYNVDGFDHEQQPLFELQSSNGDDSEVPAPTQSRQIYPDTPDIVVERRSAGTTVRIPDIKQWEAYMDYLTEQKLRALGVTLGDDEPAQPTPLSRQTSSQYPSLPFSPPIPTSSGSSQRQPPPGHMTAGSSIADITSNPTSIASPASPFGSSHGLMARSSSLVSPFGLSKQTPSWSPPEGYFSPVGARASPMAPMSLSEAALSSHTISPPLSQGEVPHTSTSNLLAQMAHQQQQLQAQLLQQQQQQQQMLASSQAMNHLRNVPEEEEIDLDAPEPRQSFPEIVNPTPRGHRHNISESLEKGAEVFTYKPPAATHEHDVEETSPTDKGDAQNVTSPPPEMLSRLSKVPESLPDVHRDRKSDVSGRRVFSDETDPGASFLSNSLVETVDTEPSEVETNPSVNGHFDGDAKRHGPRHSEVSNQSEGSKLNVQAKEFKFNPEASFNPSSFNFQNFQPSAVPAFAARSLHQPKPTFSGLPAGLNVKAQAFNPEPSIFKPDVPEFQPSGFAIPVGGGFNFSSGGPLFNKSQGAMHERMSSVQEPDPGNRIFAPIEIDTTAKPVKKSKAVPIVPPEEQFEFDEKDGRLIRSDDRMKRTRRGADDDDDVPRFAPSHHEVLRSNDLDHEFAEHVDGHHFDGINDESFEAQNRDVNDDPHRSNRPIAIANALSGSSTWKPETISQIGRVPSFEFGRQHGHKSSLSATAKPFILQFGSGPSLAPEAPAFVPGGREPASDGERENDRPVSDNDQAMRMVHDRLYAGDANDPAMPDARSSWEASPRTETPPHQNIDHALENIGQSSLAEIDDVMKHLNEEPESATDHQASYAPLGSSPRIRALNEILQPKNHVRSDAPSPSPRRVHKHIALSDEEGRDPFSDSKANVESPVRQLSDSGHISVWDDVVSSSEEYKFRMRTQFFDNHVQGLIEQLFARKLMPVERSLGLINHSLSELQVKKEARRSGRQSTGETLESDADDEDEEEVARFEPPRPRSRRRSPSKAPNMDQIKSAMVEALAMHQALVPSSQSQTLAHSFDAESFDQSLIDLKTAIARAASEKFELDDVRQVVDDAMDRHHMALVPHAGSRSPEHHEHHHHADKEHVESLERALAEATSRAAEDLNLRNDFDQVRRQLRLAEEETQLLRETLKDKDGSLSAIKSELETTHRHLREEGDDLASSKKHASSLESEVNALEETLKEYRISRDSWKREQEENHEKRKAFQSTIQGLQLQLDDGLQIRETMKLRLEQLQRDLQIAAQQVGDDKATWRKQLEDQKTRFEVMKARAEAEARTRERFEQEMIRLEEKERTSMRAQFQLEQIQTANLALHRDIENLRKENLQAHRVRKQKEGELEAAAQKMDFLVSKHEAEMSQLRSQAESMRAEAEDVRDSHADALSRAEEAKRQELSEAHQARAAIAREWEQRHQRTLEEWEDRQTRLQESHATQVAAHEERFREQQELYTKQATDFEEQLRKQQGMHANQTIELQDRLREQQELHTNQTTEYEERQKGLQQRFEQTINEQQGRHQKELDLAIEDKQQTEKLLHDRLSLSDAKLEHFQDRVQHLEEKLQIAKDAAQAAAQAAKSAQIISPRSATPVVAPAAPAAPPAASTAPSAVYEKFDHQALRQSIMVLQEQLQARESRIEDLERELAAVDKEAPEKIQQRDTEIGWLRELLGVRLDDLSELVEVLSEPEFDRDAVRDAAIRIRASLQMEQQDKERLISGQGPTFPSLATLSNFATPRANQLAAAVNSWRKGRDLPTLSSISQYAQQSIAERTSGTPSKPPVTTAQNFLSGLMTPPASNLRRSPSTGDEDTPPARPTLQHLSSASSARPVSQGSQSTTLSTRSPRRRRLTPRQLEKQPAFDPLGLGDVDEEGPVTPPLLRRGSYDQDAEDGQFSNAGFYDDESTTELQIPSNNDQNEKGGRSLAAAAEL